MNYAAVLDALAGLYPRSVEPSADIDRALGYVGAQTDAETVVGAGYVVGATAGILALVGLWLAGVGGVLQSVTPAFATGLAATHAVHRAPSVLAATRRTRALGAASDLVGRAALRMRIEPTTERAALFAARTGVGPLSRSLGDHAERATGTPGSGLDGFVDEWGDWFGSLERAIALVEASADAPEAERFRTLERAMEAVLDGTREEMAAFAAEIRGPATAVYAFGVLLPLALVGVLPAAGVAGTGLSLVHLVLVYNVLLPLALVGAGVWLLVRRPVAFPPPRVGRNHPEVANHRWPSTVAGVCGATTAWWTAATFVAPWAAPVAAAGAGFGSALAVHYYPVMTVRKRVRAVEGSLDDALYLVGRRVAEGTAVEAALARTGEEVPGATGDMLTSAVCVQRRLRVGVREAFLGPNGALSDLPSPRARGAAALLALAASEGRPAGRVIVALADQLNELDRVETDARQELASVTGTLANTAAMFGPLVGGATVALAVRLSEHEGVDGGLGTETVAAADLGVVVGVYVLLLAVVLTALSTGLERGLDRTLIGYRTGLALLSATGTYLVAIVGAGLVV